MSVGERLCVAVLAAGLISVPGARTAITQTRPTETRPDFDIRDGRDAARPRIDPSMASTVGSRRALRVNRDAGSVRLLQDPGWSPARMSVPAAIRALLVTNARRLGLEPRDLGTLTHVRDYTSRSNGVRHVEFRQAVDGYPVFDSSVAVHLRPDGSVARVTSNAASIADRDSTLSISSADARALALFHTVDGDAGSASLVWLPLDGTLQLAWHVAVTARDDLAVYDVLVDAESADLLIRRNRVRNADGTGRVLQSSAADPRLPDPFPRGGDGTSCPPPANHVLRSLNAPFRDPGTVLGTTGRLEGNNVRVFRGTTTVPAATGTHDGSGWTFDFPFNSAGSAETFMFFAMNFAHDFFYDLGFDEGAGNFQLDNFGRGGLGGDPLKANARAQGRNNANYMHAADGSSSTINMFLWDGSGCWAEDVDGDGAADLDGDYDLDIIIHEYHHGVSLRLNTAFTGNEAGAMGEGGGDFFAYSVNGDPILAEYSRPGGLRHVNEKTYGDWTCLLGIICEVHDNGEIFANALWDVRERFRTDLVRGSQAAAVNESHQIYVDAMTLAPPAPTMLDMRDAMLEADTLRNGGSPISQNFCRLWESFAGRGMGVSATDTADNGFNRVGPAYDVPDGCTPPPAPPLVTINATAPTAREAGLVPGVLTFTRESSSQTALTVNYSVRGTATGGADFRPLQGWVTIPAESLTVTLTVTPVDDGIVESNETVIVTIGSGAGYSIGSPSAATITIESDDVAADMVVPEFTAPRRAAAGATIDVTDTTRNQGLGAAPSSQTAFYLSTNALLDTNDRFLGNRVVPALTPDAESTATTSVTLPVPLDAGTYYLFAKSDAAGAITETNELNNTRLVSIGVGPDLTVTSITAPTIASAGASILVSDTTANQGAGDAAASATRFFLSANALLDAGDTGLQSRNVPALPAGQSSTGSTTVTIPPNTTTGNYYLFAAADTGGVVAEATENNNWRSALIRIGPDLSVAALTVPTRAGAGTIISITDTVRNIGAGTAASSTTAFYLSTNFALDSGDIRLSASRTVPPLGTSESSTGTTAVVLPQVAAGSWVVIARADDTNTVVETQEGNNARFASVLIGPDLTFLTASAPSSAVAGSAISVNTVTRNAGAGPASASVIRFYLSNNVTLDASDFQLDAVRNVPPLDSDASDSGTTTVPLPTNRTGAQYLIIMVDADQTVAETSELNNVTVRFIQISPGS